VPYKAFDGIVDALSAPTSSRWITTSRASSSGVVRPRRAAVPVSCASRCRPGARARAGVARARAARAGVHRADLTCSAASRAPAAAVFVDDLQWADADSMLLLRELMHPSHAPPLAFLARSARAKLASIPPVTSRAPRAPSSPAACNSPAPSRRRRAARRDRLLPARRGVRRAPVEIARRSRRPLAVPRRARAPPVGARPARTSARLDDGAVGARPLSLESRRANILQMIAVAGVPLDQKTAADASGLTSTRAAPLVARAAGERPRQDDRDRRRRQRPRALPRPRARAGVDGPRYGGTASCRGLGAKLAHALLRVAWARRTRELVVRHLPRGGQAAGPRPVRARRGAGPSTCSAVDPRRLSFLRAALAAGPRDAVHWRALHTALAEALANAGPRSRGRRRVLAPPGRGCDDEASSTTAGAIRIAVASGHVDGGS